MLGNSDIIHCDTLLVGYNGARYQGLAY